MENLDWALVKYRSGSLSAQEAASKIRGGEGLLDLIAIRVFVVVINIFFPARAEGFPQDYTPFMNPVGFLFGPQAWRGSVGSQPRWTLQMKKPTRMSQEQYSHL